jgi:lipoprotein-releasing system permease protein
MNRGGLVRLTTISAVFCIAMGVASLIVVQAIYSGFREGVEKKLLSQTAHLTVNAEQPGGASPTLVTKTLIGDAEVKRVDPVLFQSAVASYQGRSAYGLIRVEFAEGSNETTARGIQIGKGLAERIKVNLGDKFEILFQQKNGEASTLEFLISGLIETGLFEYDSQLIKIPRKGYLQATGSAAVPNAFLVSLHDPFKAEESAKRLRRVLGPSYTVVDWESANRPLFTALSFERRIAFFVFAIMIALASLGIAATIALLINERRIDLAILKTCGARTRSLFKIFIIEGALIGIAGVVIGLSFGFLTCSVANVLDLVNLSGEVYAVSKIELVPGFVSTTLISVGAFALLFPSIALPVFRASRIKPAVLLRTL